jgi:thymidylate synthase (FAD)
VRIFCDGPRVILLARPSLVPEGVDEALLEYGEGTAWRRDDGDGDGEGLAEFMGRVCYGSFGARQGRVGAARYHAHVLESGHGSILEHACWSFLVTRASRAFTHQVVRHRAGVSPSQESQHFIRYSPWDDDADAGAQEAGACLAGIPEELRAAFAASAARALEDYAVLVTRLKTRGLGKKEACELARGLLPNCLESRVGLTMNARAIRHVVELRGQPGNALEIRLFAVRLAELMKREAPALFQDVEIVADAGDGRPAAKSEWRKA